jgi:nucleoside-diphosphate-sugar epimerase
LDATEQFIVDNKPSFSIISIMPGFVIGTNHVAMDSQTLAKGSNAIPISVISGKKSPAGRPGSVAHIKDVARVHVGALSPAISGNRSFVVDVGPVDFDDVIKVAEREFPEAVKEGIISTEGSAPALPINVDSSETVAVFGPLGSYEEAVKDLLAQFIELKKGGK